MAPKKQPAAGGRLIAANRKARHDYEVLETVECGIALMGSEVKSLREGRVQLRDAYARVQDGEMWLHAANIAPYAFSSGRDGHDPERPRKLLLHRDEIDELGARVAQDRLALVPLSVYFKENRIKVELALARGRKNYDKRHALAERDASREVAKALGRHAKGHDD